MGTIEEIRHANLMLILAALEKEHGEHGSIQRLATSAGRPHSQVSQLKNKSKHSKTGKPRNIGPTVARALETAVGKPRGWMDVPHDGESADEKLARLIDEAVTKRLKESAAHPFIQPEKRDGTNR